MTQENLYPNAYNPSGLDSSNFVDFMGNYAGIQQGIDAVRKDPTNRGKARKLETALLGEVEEDQRLFTQGGDAAMSVVGAGSNAIGQASNTIIEYVSAGDNRKDLISKLGKEEALNLLLNLPEEFEEGYGNVSEAVKNYKMILKAGEDPSKARELVVKELEKYAPWLQRAIVENSTPEKYTATIFKAISSTSQREFYKLISSDEGEINRELVNELIYQAYNSLSSDDQKPMDLNLAQLAYSSLTKED